MSDKMEKLINKINRGRIGYATMIDASEESSLVRIVDSRTLNTVALLDTETGSLKVLANTFTWQELSNFNKLLQIIVNG